MAECIHGFDEGMCDICFPRVRPAAAEEAPARRSATATATRTASTRPRAGSPASSGGSSRPASVPPFGARRLYHATPLPNLESILLDGEVRAMASDLDPDVDVSAPLVRQLRAAADVGDGRRVDAFVPFAASPDADRWAELRTGADGAQWTDAARGLGVSDWAVLVATGKDLGADVVVSDGDASAPATSFVIGEPAKALARVARADPELAGAEVLVPGPVPLSAISLIAVANDPARARVRRMFADVEGVAPRVVVHPPWFGTA